MTDGWWPAPEFVVEVAQRIGIVGQIRVFPDDSFWPAAAAQYRGTLDGRHQIAIYPRLTESAGIVALAHELVHVAQAQEMGYPAFAAWGNAEEARVGNRFDGQHEVEARARAEELAAEYLEPGTLITYVRPTMTEVAR